MNFLHGSFKLKPHENADWLALRIRANDPKRFGIFSDSKWATQSAVKKRNSEDDDRRSIQDGGESDKENDDFDYEGWRQTETWLRRKFLQTPKPTNAESLIRAFKTARGKKASMAQIRAEIEDVFGKDEDQATTSSSVTPVRRPPRPIPSSTMTSSSTSTYYRPLLKTPAEEPIRPQKSPSAQSFVSLDKENPFLEEERRRTKEERQFRLSVPFPPNRPNFETFPVEAKREFSSFPFPPTAAEDDQWPPHIVYSIDTMSKKPPEDAWPYNVDDKSASMQENQFPFPLEEAVKTSFGADDVRLQDEMIARTMEEEKIRLWK